MKPEKQSRGSVCSPEALDRYCTRGEQAQYSVRISATLINSVAVAIVGFVDIDCAVGCSHVILRIVIVILLSGVLTFPLVSSWTVSKASTVLTVIVNDYVVAGSYLSLGVSFEVTAKIHFMCQLGHGSRSSEARRPQIHFIVICGYMYGRRGRTSTGLSQDFGDTHWICWIYRHRLATPPTALTNISVTSWCHGQESCQLSNRRHRTTHPR